MLYTQDFYKYISQIFFGYIIPLSIIGALVMFISGGLFMIFSSGDTNKIQLGKEIITGTVIGLILILLSTLILGAMDPGLKQVFIP